MRALVASLLALLLAAAGAAEAQVAFRTEGGDAWTFEKQVELTVDRAACPTLMVVSPVATFLTHPQAEQVTVPVPLRPGDNRIEARCRKDGAPVGGAARQHWQVRLRDAPVARITTSIEPGAIVLDAGGSEVAPARPEPLIRFAWRAAAGNPAPLASLPAEGARLSLALPRADGEYRVTLRATDAAGRSGESTVMFRRRGAKVESFAPAAARAAWIDHAVVYGVVPGLFGPRGLADVAAALDRLKALGVNTLWLLPITASPPEDFGYAVIDHFRLREGLGSDADLRALVRGAHDRGMRVIMDFVPNHLSDQHPYFRDLQRKGQASAYRDFFARDDAGRVANYFDWDNLKNLNFDHPEVRRMVIEAFAYWVREFDIDGFRVDVAWGPRERAADFWPAWAAEMKRLKPDLLLLAEASVHDPYYLKHFDLAYDWTEKLGQWAWAMAFEERTATAQHLRTAIAAAPGGSVFRFLENNDTAARFVTRHGAERTRVAAAMLLTLPGIPALFTGQEVGAEYEPYDEPPPLSWQDRHGLAAWYARLIALRRAEPALRVGSLQLLDVQPADTVLAYLRRTGDETVLVLLNYGEAPVEARVAMPPGLLGRTLVDLLRADGAPVKAGDAVALPGLGSRVLKSP